MFKVLSVEGKNFRSFKNINITLDGSAAAFIGPMGSGKSTIVEIIEYLLTGKTRESGDKGQGSIRAMRWHAEKDGKQKYPRMACRGTFDVDGKVYRITRTESEERKELGFEMLELGNVHAMSMPGDMKGTQKEIERVLLNGISAFNYMDRAKAKVMASANVADRRKSLYDAVSAFVTPEEMLEATLTCCDVRDVMFSHPEYLGDNIETVLRKYGVEDLGQLEERFLTIFNGCAQRVKIMSFEELDKVARVLRPEVKRENDKVIDRLKVLKSAEVPIFLTPERILAMESEVSRCEMAIADKDKERMSAAERDGKKRAIESADMAVKAMVSNITGARGAVINAESTIQLAQENIVSIESELQDFDTLLNETDRSRQVLEKFQKAVDDLNEKSRAVVEQISAKVGEKVGEETAVKLKEQAISDLRDQRKIKQEVCPSCGEALKCGACGVSVGTDKKSIDNTISSIRGEISYKKKKTILKIEKEILELRNVLESIEKDLSRDREDMETHRTKACRDVQGEIKALRRRAEEERNVIERNKIVVTEKETLLKTALIDLTAAETNLNNLKLESVGGKTVSDLDSEMSTLRKEADEWKLKLSNAKKQSENIGRDKEEIDALELEYSRNITDYKVYDEIIKAFGPSGARSAIMRGAMSAIADKANAILSSAFHMKVFFGGEDGVDIRIKKDDAELDIEQLSEGQFSAVAVALQAASAGEDPIYVDGLDVMTEDEMCIIFSTLATLSTEGTIGQLLACTCRECVRQAFTKSYDVTMTSGISEVLNAA